MRTGYLVSLAAVVVLVLPDYGSGTLMLGSLLMALKGGLFASKLGMGGMLAMMMAASKPDNQLGASLVNTAKAISSLANSQTFRNLNLGTGTANQRRTRREIDPNLIPDLPLLLNASVSVGNASVEPPMSVEKLAHELNNLTSPVTQRVMRQAAILDQLSCLPRILCGINAQSQTPSKQTSLLNDYGFLMKFLFERDDDQDDAEEDDEEEEAARLDKVALKKSSNSTLETTEKPKSKKKRPSEDSDAESEEGDDVDVKDGEFEDFDEDEKWEEMAEEALINDDPGMMSYVLADHNMRLKQRKEKTKKGGYGTYNVDHSYLPGYDKGSYHVKSNPLLNTKSAQAVLDEPSTHYSVRRPPGHYHGQHYGQQQPPKKRFEFKLGLGKDKGNPSIFKHLLPSFIYNKVKVNTAANADSSVGDDFAKDPFFDGFKRRRALGEEEGETDPQREARIQAFIQKKQELIDKSKDPLTKYRVAERVGRLFRNQRQCRMLFARCPYTYTEITTMIDNMKKLLAAQATVGDQVVNLKQTGNQNDATKSTSTLLSSGGYLNAPSANAGVTSIMHQLDNGDKVEIMLKIKQKDGQTSSPVVVKDSDSLLLSHYKDKDLIEAHKNLLAMKKQFQSLAKLHNATLQLQNKTSIRLPDGLITKNEDRYPVLQGVPPRPVGTRYTISKPSVNLKAPSVVVPGVTYAGGYPHLSAVPNWAGSQYVGKIPTPSKVPELLDAEGSNEGNTSDEEGQNTSQGDAGSDEPGKKKGQKSKPSKKKKPEEEEEEDEEEEDQEEQDDEEEDNIGDLEVFVPGQKPPEVPPLPLFRSQTEGTKATKGQRVPSQTISSRTSSVAVLKTRPPGPLPTRPAPYKIRRKSKGKGGSRHREPEDEN